MIRRSLYIAIGLLIMVGAITIAYAADLAIYSGPTNTGWISQDAAKENAQTILTDSKMIDIFENLENN